MKSLSKTQGFTLVEVLVSTSIILVCVVTLLGVHSLYIKTALNNSESLKAAYLAEEGLEVVRFWRNLSWNNKVKANTLDTNFGITFSGGVWATSTNRYIGIFERTLAFSSVQRNASGDIVASGGTIDPNILLVTATVAWSKGGAATTKSIATYFTNLYDN